MNNIVLDPLKLYSKKFIKMYIHVVENTYLRYVAKGGRGSGKSTNIAGFIIEQVMEHPITALVIRKVGNTLKESVYEELKEAIDRMGLESLFQFKVSPLQIIYKPRGNKIIFRGADDPMKIKSIKVSKFPVALLWIEELAEFKLEEDITTIEASILRKKLPDGMRYKFFYSYNPPKRKQSWVNKKYNSAFVDKNTYVDHSTYKDNPFITEEFIEEAENMKKQNPLKYRYIYGGEALGSGVVPFDNLRIEKIPDELFKTFDTFYNGNDFGYANDPLAFVRWHFDKKKNIIYAVDEIYGVKISDRELANKLKQKGYQSEVVLCDSAEPDRIANLRDEFDIKKVRGAKKGAGSVEYGEEWLDDLTAIVIDPERTPNIAREFENIDYETDKDGNPKNRLEGENNHTIDATRYAFSEIMRTHKKPDTKNIRKKLGI